MKTIVAATVAFVALAAPTLALAGQVYYDPAEGDFVAGTANVAPTSADTSRYAQDVTFYDPAEGGFTSAKVGAAPVIGTHDAAKSTGVVTHYYDPAEGGFSDMVVSN